MMSRLLPLILTGIAALALAPLAAQEETPRPGAIEAIPFEQLTDRNIAAAGAQALALGDKPWNHAETAHFVIHYHSSFIATPVAVEAEFYYRVIMKDLGLEPPEDAAKHHLYLFEDGELWASFRDHTGLEPWTGAVKIGGELFVPRNPKARFKGNALGHEIAHLLVQRYLGDHLPLWLNEGYAEDVSVRGYAAFQRARGLNARPRAAAVDAPMPLSRLTAMDRYPENEEIFLFYLQSRRLVGFLNRFGETKRFRALLQACATGTPFETALRDAYGPRWHSLDALEADFKKELAR